ncbi:hypothetical protein PR048_029782 [Dryococelus australis]|uniref:Integrase catalytic domain-containing protein n=1 Tax=Dryococelus australis TaxID=614101 RepID=A0ABQ9G736_9NEOP|nr:hypothetical protein PR048_029782 [Dryococelus australis]
MLMCLVPFLVLVLGTLIVLIYLFYPLRSMKSVEICKVLCQRLYHVFGSPVTMVTDNATYFVSAEFKNLAFALGVKVIETTSCYPQANLVERYNHNLMVAIWGVGLYQLSLAFDNVLSSATKRVPAELFFSTSLFHLLINAWGLNEFCWEALDVRELEGIWAETMQSGVRSDTFLCNKAAKFSSKLATKFAAPFIVRRFLTPRLRGVVVVRLLASHLGEQGSIPGGINPGLLHVGNIPDDTTGRWGKFTDNKYTHSKVKQVPYSLWLGDGPVLCIASTLPHTHMCCNTYLKRQLFVCMVLRHGGFQGSHLEYCGWKQALDSQSAHDCRDVPAALWLVALAGGSCGVEHSLLLHSLHSATNDVVSKVIWGVERGLSQRGIWWGCGGEETPGVTTQGRLSHAPASLDCRLQEGPELSQLPRTEIAAHTRRRIERKRLWISAGVSASMRATRSSVVNVADRPRDTCFRWERYPTRLCIVVLLQGPGQALKVVDNNRLQCDGEQCITRPAYATDEPSWCCKQVWDWRRRWLAIRPSWPECLACGEQSAATSVMGTWTTCPDVEAGDGACLWG